MIQTTNVYKQAIQEDRREWRERAIITLHDPAHSGTELTLTNQNLWSGGFTVEDATSADNVFQIGAAIVNKATLVINNIYGTYDAYDFALADVQLQVGVAAECDIDTDILPPPPNSASDPDNGWVDGFVSTGGTINPGTDYPDYKFKASDFVRVDGGREYTVSYNFTQTPSAEAWTRISTYNKNKEFIANYSSTVQATGEPISFSRTLSLDTAYIRVSLRTFGMVNDDQQSNERFQLNETSLPQYYNKGKYIVNSATYNGSLITLECFDYMCKFDFAYTNSLTWPATPNYIVRNACNLCGVTFGTGDFYYPSTFKLSEPDGKGLTFRDVISYVAQICGCYARINKDGALELKWYDQDALDVETPSTTGTNVWHIDSLYSKDISTVDIAPTVISITYDTGNPEEPEYTSSVYIPSWSSSTTYDTGNVVRRSNRIYRSLIDNNTTAPTMSTTTQWRYIADSTNAYTLNVPAWSSANRPYAYGDVVKRSNKIWRSLRDNNNATPNIAQSTSWKYVSENTLGYVIEIVNNPLINADNVDTIIAHLGDKMLGHAFRRATISHGSDPSMEAGDTAIAILPDGTSYRRLLVSKTTFSTGSAQTTMSSAAPPVKNESTKYSVETRNLVSLQRMIRKEISTRDAAYNDLVTALSSYGGLNLTTEPDEINGGTIFYLHDGQTVQTSSTVYKITAGGWGISTDGGQTWNTGITAYGVMVVNLLSATGISFDWAEGGTLTLGGADNGDGVLVIKDAYGDVVGTINNQKFEIAPVNSDYGEMRFNYDDGSLELIANNYVALEGTWRAASLKLVNLVTNFPGTPYYSNGLFIKSYNDKNTYQINYGFNGICFTRKSGSTWIELASILADWYHPDPPDDDYDVPTGYFILKNVRFYSGDNNNSIAAPAYVDVSDSGKTWDNWSTLGNSWYYKMGTRVHIHIAAQNFTANSNQTFMTMPSKYRPGKYICNCGRGASGTDYASAWVTASGAVSFISATTKCCVDLEYDATQ